MTDLPFDHLAPDDLELVSAYIDGEATPAEVEHVEATPSLRAWADRLRALAGVVAEPPAAVAPDVQARMIDRAMAAGASVHSLADARATRDHRRGARRWLPALSAAAVLLILLAVVPVLLRSGGQNTDTTALGTGADRDDSAASASTTPAAGPGASNGGASTGPQPDAAGGVLSLGSVSDGDLGGYDDLGVLASTARDRFAARLAASEAAPPPTTAADATTTNAVVATCEPELMATDGLITALRYFATATLDDDPVSVLVFEMATGGPEAFRLYVVGPDCRVLTTADF